MDLRKILANPKGVTLAELMVATVLISIGILAIVKSFQGIAESSMLSKGRTLANNLAQEKLQILKQKTYARLIITTIPNYRTNVSPTISYDASYYPPETLMEGGISFTRYSFVEYVHEDSGVIQPDPPTSDDTGMKRITISVVWSERNQTKVLQLTSIESNMSTVMGRSVFNGAITRAGGGAISGATVNVAENTGWMDTANSSGQYSILVSPGNYNLVATATGYYTQTKSVSIAVGTTQTNNFTLTAIGTATIRGAAWVNTHALISQVVASTGSANEIEYVELYNPTTAAINIGTNAGYATPDIWMMVWDAAGNSVQQRQLVYISTFVPAYGYYLISNTGDGNGTSAAINCNPVAIAGATINPDACWRFVGGGGADVHTLQCNPIITAGCIGGPNAGGVAIGSNGGLSWGSGTMRYYDSLAWSGTGSTPTDPREGTAATTGSALGLNAGERFVRRTDTSTVVSTSYGNAYDSNNNLTDFIFEATIPWAPRNSSSALPPRSGTPAYGSIVTVTDGLSAAATAYAAGNPPYAEFMLPDVATGTWVVNIASNTSVLEIQNVTLSHNTTSWVPTPTSTPSGPTGGIYSAILASEATQGYVSGRVLGASGNPLSGIAVSNGTTSTNTTANGFYSMAMPAGTYAITANPNNASPTYVSQTEPSIPVTLGQVNNGVDFVLSQGGRARGFVSRDGTTALPGIVFKAKDANGIIQDEEVSASNGYFILNNLSTGTYTIEPVLEEGESSTPLSANVTVTSGGLIWSSSFTVIGAFGTLTGNVSSGGQPIKSGVLIVVATSTISGVPPALSSSTLSSAPLYVQSSMEDGSYSMEVRGSTTTTYRVHAFYPQISSNGSTVSVSTAAQAGITINPGLTTSGINFSW